MIPFELVQISAGIGGALLTYHLGTQDGDPRYYVRNIRRVNLKDSFIPLITYFGTGVLSSVAVTLVEATRNPDQVSSSLIPILAAGLVTMASAVIGGLVSSRNDNNADL
jgi:hypothetical protein